MTVTAPNSSHVRREVAKSILNELRKELGEPMPQDAEEMKKFPMDDKLFPLTPELETLYHRLLGMLEGISEGLISGGETALREDLYEFGVGYSRLPKVNLEVLATINQSVREAARVGLTSEPSREKTRHIT